MATPTPEQVIDAFKSANQDKVSSWDNMNITANNITNTTADVIIDCQDANTNYFGNTTIHCQLKTSYTFHVTIRCNWVEGDNLTFDVEVGVDIDESGKRQLVFPSVIPILITNIMGSDPSSYIEWNGISGDPIIHFVCDDPTFQDFNLLDEAQRLHDWFNNHGNWSFTSSVGNNITFTIELDATDGFTINGTAKEFYLVGHPSSSITWNFTNYQVPHGETITQSMKNLFFKEA